MTRCSAVCSAIEWDVPRRRPGHSVCDDAPAVRIDVFTIFPHLVDGFCWFSLLGKARLAGLVDLRVHDLRSLAIDPHRSVDDSPYGGGAGMVLRPEPVFDAVEAAQPVRPLLLLGP